MERKNPSNTTQQTVFKNLCQMLIRSAMEIDEKFACVSKMTEFKNRK